MASSKMIFNKPSDNMIYDIVLFHYPCQDGLASAWVVYYYYALYNINIELYPISHGDTIDIKRLVGKRVLICDYSPRPEVLDEIVKVVSKITILDHHISAQKLLHDREYAIFDMNRSGAGITWDFFFPDTEMPLFIKMVQDGDLWKWQVKDSKNFLSGFDLEYKKLDSLDFEKIFKLFDQLFLDESRMAYYISCGIDFNKSKTERLQKMAKEHETTITKYKGFNVCSVECNYEDSSELGNILSSKPEIDFAVLWQYFSPKEEYHIGFRSCGDVDVSVIASSFGGGGHKNASGCANKKHPSELLQ